MKYLSVSAVVAALFFATSVHAVDLGSGWSAGATLKGEYNITDETDVTLMTPYVGYSNWGMDWSVESELDLQDMGNEELDLKWAMHHMLLDKVDAYVKVNTNGDFETDDLTIGAEWKF